MTRNQTAILNFLKKDNKQAMNNGLAYLTDIKPLEDFCAQIPNDNAGIFLQNYPALKKDLNADFEQLCWFLYFNSVSGASAYKNIGDANNDFLQVPDTPQNKSLWLLLTQILNNLNRLGGKYNEMAQNRGINNFSKTLPIGFQPELMVVENTATSIVKGKDGAKDIRYILHNYWLDSNQTKSLTPSISALKLLYFELILFSASHKQCSRVSLREYAGLIKGKNPSEISDSTLKDIKKQVVDDLLFLSNIGADYEEKINGKWQFCGIDRWNGGTAKVDHGYIVWNWNTEFVPQLERLAPSVCNMNIFTARLNSDEFFFYDLIDKNYRYNEDKPERLNKIKITQFLEACKRIPKYENVKNSDYRKQIMKPFHTILDNLKDIEALTFNEAGEPRETFKDWKDYEEFENGYVFIDYSDYPVHSTRIDNKKAHAKKKAQSKDTKKKK